MNKTEEFIGLVLDAFGAGIIKKLVFSRPKSSRVLRVSGRLVLHKNRRLLAFEYSLPENTVSHKNIEENALSQTLAELLAEYSQANLITTLGECEWKRSKSGAEVLLGSDKLKRKMNTDTPVFEQAIEALDHRAKRIIPEDADFLIGLGISDAKGRVHDKKQGKYRQINRFIEHIEELYPKIADKDEPLVFDLCCGKSYLSFAVYYYLWRVKGKNPRMLGIDRRTDVIEWCDSLARSLGYRGMRFVTDDVRNTPRDEAPDMVVSLHACDIATDVVIDTAAELGAKIILSTPCCHRYLTDKIDMPSLSLVTKHPHLKNKLAELLTDGLRTARLESFGYEVRALELTDPTDTPKNTLIRAEKKNLSPDELKARAARYDELLTLVLGENKKDYLKEIK